MVVPRVSDVIRGKLHWVRAQTARIAQIYFVEAGSKRFSKSVICAVFISTKFKISGKN
jgi:hypothetical protein